jgi:F0F1-type ATP synthase assembly protein I
MKKTVVVGFPMGIIIGVIFGALIDNMAIGILLGLALGLGVIKFGGGKKSANEVAASKSSDMDEEAPKP